MYRSGTSAKINPPSMNPSMPIIASTGGEDEEIRLLTDQLQLELGNLASTHSVLEADMQRLASMLGPFMTPAGRLNLPEKMDPKVLLFKQGLDFRISEYNEDCRRLENIQERLQRKLEEAAGAYERTFMGATGLADARIIRRLEELQRIIQVQQQELDQARFERDVVADEAKRLRHMFVKNGGSSVKQPQMMAGLSNQQEPFSTVPTSLHTVTSAKFVPMAGPSQTLHAPGMMGIAANAIPQPTMMTVGITQQPNMRQQPGTTTPGTAAPGQPVDSPQGWADWWTGQPSSANPAPPAARKDFI